MSDFARLPGNVLWRLSLEPRSVSVPPGVRRPRRCLRKRHPKLNQANISSRYVMQTISASVTLGRFLFRLFNPNGSIGEDWSGTVDAPPRTGECLVSFVAISGGAL